MSAPTSVERLDADLELQRAGRKLGDDFAQRFRQAVGNHLEMKKMSGLIAREEEFEDAPGWWRRSD